MSIIEISTEDFYSSQIYSGGMKLSFEGIDYTFYGKMYFGNIFIEIYKDIDYMLFTEFTGGEKRIYKISLVKSVSTNHDIFDDAVIATEEFKRLSLESEIVKLCYNGSEYFISSSVKNRYEDKEVINHFLNVIL